ncbi:hypothetical protein BDP81DRAFT_8636 [Colletotrichum phormii]|uniref:Uncharacterized protein n=1 Tax=Colletotrichum phormii TaxID=359342 RepID=A0AAJ0EKZ1_9PEZI|nr:uncharacterized protein BDP81DRAFT_8636 [Colletotrichum phormii]KAK1655711.1 hypothetical protein BDP81DRAFT_8636 [Colletotrichum phormii]
MPGPGPGFHAIVAGGGFSRVPFMQLSDLLASCQLFTTITKRQEVFALPRERCDPGGGEPSCAAAQVVTRYCWGGNQESAMELQGLAQGWPGRSIVREREQDMPEALGMRSMKPIDKPDARVPNRPEPGGRHPTIAAHAARSPHRWHMLSHARILFCVSPFFLVCHWEK